ncbi:hypothetical protein H4R24_002821 [Coemansia sp. RSA 988]|nr:hypothetical protein H4R24_002821 [Coemansia sp. RSA 988]
MTWDLMEAEQDLHKSWMRIFNINPLSLQRVEHYYGCCGFSDRDDMPSHPDCLKGLDDSIVNGCASYLAQSTFDRNRMAIIRCAIAMVLQILFIVIGWGLVAGVLEPNTRWIAEDRNQEENWAAGTSQAPPTTADVTVDESGPQNTPEAHMLDVADDELLGLSSDVQPKSVLATSKAVVVHHGDDATHLPEN